MNREPDGSWLQERLFERRIVSCRGVLDDALAGRVSAELMTLDALGDAAVELQLDARGASLEAAWTLIDVIDLLGVRVNIVCSGRVEGAAVGVLSAGAHRRALADARFRLTDPELEISGRASSSWRCSTTIAGASTGCTSASASRRGAPPPTWRPTSDPGCPSMLARPSATASSTRSPGTSPSSARSASPAPLGSHETARAERPSRLPGRSAAPQLLVVRGQMSWCVPAVQIAPNRACLGCCTPLIRHVPICCCDVDRSVV